MLSYVRWQGQQRQKGLGLVHDLDGLQTSQQLSQTPLAIYLSKLPLPTPPDYTNRGSPRGVADGRRASGSDKEGIEKGRLQG